MRVTTVLGLGAFALLCLAPDAAQAQRRMGYSGPGYYPSGPTVFGQNLQPGYFGGSYGGYYGTPQYYGPGVSYGTGMPYGTGASYAPQMYQAQPYASQPYANATQPYVNQPYAYQPYANQQYGYQPYATGGCPPGQPLSPSAMAGTAPQSMPSATTGSATGQTATASTVSAQDDTFEPMTLTIQQGATVTWTNRGQHVHTVTFDVGRDSGDLPPGGSFSATFPHAGTYRYHCHHHPDMKGTVTVQGGGSGDQEKSSSSPKTGD